jgi:hypothetical protein
MAWHYMQYAIGLAALGHDVWYVEDSGDDEWACYDPTTGMTGPDPTYGLRFAGEALACVGLGDRWAYHDALAGQWHGPAAASAVAACEEADLVINVSHANMLRPWLQHAPVRALIDTDPVFTQIRHLSDESRMERAAMHNAFFTFGENVVRGALPDDGLPWRPTRQPIALDKWRMTEGMPNASFTTVMQWEGYPPLEYDGRHYGTKGESFESYMTLAGRTVQKLEISVGSDSAPRDDLKKYGWKLRNPLDATRDPWRYQRYIRRSKAEFSVAKHGYASTRCGWFSERTANYLASGRPAVVQETGFSDWMDTGAGIISFDSADEALAGVDEVSARYDKHCKAARDVAESYFDASRVLSALVEEAMNNHGSSAARTPSGAMA